MSSRPNRLLVLFFLGASVVCSAASRPDIAKKTQISGYLVDVSCSKDEAEAGSSPAWGQKHSRGCLLMPVCVRSGYAVLTPNNEVVRFDSKGNEQAHRLILDTNRDANWRVVVHGIRQGDQVAVSKIDLLK